jgi:hypothetical protein
VQVVPAAVHPLLLAVFGPKRAALVVAQTANAIKVGRPALPTAPPGRRQRIKVMAQPKAPGAPAVTKFDAEQERRIALAHKCIAAAKQRGNKAEIDRLEARLVELLEGKPKPVVCIAGFGGLGVLPPEQHQHARSMLKSAYALIEPTDNPDAAPGAVRLQFIQAILAVVGVQQPALYSGLTPEAAGTFMVALKLNAAVWQALGTGDIPAAFKAMEEAARAEGTSPLPENIQKANHQNVYDAGKEIASALGEKLYLKLGGIPTMLLVGGAVVVGVGLLWLVMRRRSAPAEAA